MPETRYPRPETMPIAQAKPQLLRASLLGGIVGDCLGAEIEVWSLDQFGARFRDGLTDLPPHDAIRGAITEDTQLTLFTAEGILDASQRGIDRGILHPPSSVHYALLRWLETQGHRSGQTLRPTGLITDHRLHTRHAPGLTCLSGIRGRQDDWASLGGGWTDEEPLFIALCACLSSCDFEPACTSICNSGGARSPGLSSEVMWPRHMFRAQRSVRHRFQNGLGGEIEAVEILLHVTSGISEERAGRTVGRLGFAPIGGGLCGQGEVGVSTVDSGPGRNNFSGLGVVVKDLGTIGGARAGFK